MLIHCKLSIKIERMVFKFSEYVKSRMSANAVEKQIDVSVCNPMVNLDSIVLQRIAYIERKCEWIMPECGIVFLQAIGN